MAGKKPPLILHPVRIRILEVLQGRQLTPYQMHAMLQDIPLPSLYRHIKLLVEGEVIQPVSSQQRHGAVEHAYEAVPGGGRVSLEEFAEISPEDHVKYFQTFTGEQLTAFNRYINQPDCVPVSDGLRYFCTVLALNQQEFEQLWTEIHGVLAKYQQHPEGDGRTRRQFAIEAIPQTNFSKPE